GEATDTAFEADFGHGGDVALNSRNGSLSFVAGSEIDVSAAAAGKSDGGEVVFSAGAWSDAALAGKVNLASSATGRSGRATVEVVQRFTNPASTAAMISAVDSHVTDAAARAAGIRNGLALTGVAAADVRIRAAAEVETTGNLTIDQVWDLATAERRPDGVAGRLTLRSAGDLTISKSLGFAADTTVSGIKTDVLPTGDTWDIELVGGADTTSANRMATVTSNAGDVTLKGADAKVRTGTGSIRVAAGHNFVIDNAAAALYTAGEAAVVDGQRNRYTEGGGDIRITAGRDIVGAEGQAFVTSWLRRTTDTTFVKAEALPVGWWSERARFGQLGSFGGGDIAVEAGGSVDNLTVVAPTNGQPSGSASARGLTVRGGGNIRVEAEGSIDGGDYLVGRGNARLTAGDAFGGNKRPAFYLLGASGTDGGFPATFDVVARNAARLLSAANPTMYMLTRVTGGAIDGFHGNGQTVYSTYARDSSVSLKSIAGAVSFGGNPTDPEYPDSRLNGLALGDTYQYSPPKFSAVAFQNSVSGPTSISGTTESIDTVRFFPSVDQQLRFYGQDSVTRLKIAASDRDPATLPSWRTPVAGQSASSVGSRLTQIYRAPGKLVTGNDIGPYRYRFVAVEGDLAEMNVVLSDASLFSAGHDLRNLTLELQNQRADQLTLLQAGRDFRYGAKLLNGEPVNTGNSYLRMGGPGRLAIQVGRNIDFGNSAGIDAGGNGFNPSLLEADSARLSLLAGLKADQAGAAPDFAALDTFFAKLKAINKSDKSTGQKIAETEALEAAAFDGMTVGEGRIDMAFSQVRTTNNGAVDVIAPRGDVRVGLPVQLFKDKKVRDDLGIVAQGGDVRAYLDGDFDVSQSKVVAMLGGEIMVYSRNGDIDAGRGSRESRSTSPPSVEDVLEDGKPTGVKRFVPPTDVGGSGIRTVTFDPDGSGPMEKPKAGGIFLFAPRGSVDAGEA
ncbi:MAG: filamentous hemagglutinin family protein, partial [Rhodocyclales bacterium]|nr:filamentous hemagglutinin family protein [Rhodocyclales bacterium]